jgi:carboxypeptidase Taq
MPSPAAKPARVVTPHEILTGNEVDPIEARLANGEDQMLVNWLAERVYPLGRSVNAEQLVELVTGSTLTAEPFLTYLEQKLDRLIG